MISGIVLPEKIFLIVGFLMETLPHIADLSYFCRALSRCWLDNNKIILYNKQKGKMKKSLLQKIIPSQIPKKSLFLIYLKRSIRKDLMKMIRENPYQMKERKKQKLLPINS